MTDEQQHPPLPDHPELRAIAVALEEAGVSGEIFDSRWHLVYTSTEECHIIGYPVEEAVRFYGKSTIRRQVEDADTWGVDESTSAAWWRDNVPIMRATVGTDDDDFDEIFHLAAAAARRVEPHPDPPRAWASKANFPSGHRFRDRWLGGNVFIDVRLNDDTGDFLGTLRLSRPDLGDSLLLQLAKGDRRMFERMRSVAEPGRRAAGVLFADLEASGELSRRLSSRAYFELVRELVEIIDGEVVAHGGIVGKHAGDGASALFLVEHLGSESGAAEATVAAGRAIREFAVRLGPSDIDVRINVGVHWGGTLTIGQVATSGRLEVTALGDEMNEGARIEGVATGGDLLASKHLLERLEPSTAGGFGIDLDGLSYRTVAELAGENDKAVRDAGAIPVTSI